MALYNSCEMPWLENVVNTYASNSSNIYSDTELRACCTSPGVCPNSHTGACPYASINCQIGNSKWVCRFNAYDKTVVPQTCYQEGSLAVTRNKPCCPPMLRDFLHNQICLSGTGSVSDNWVCCPSGAGSCEFVLGCIGYQGFLAQLGRQFAVYTGYVKGLTPIGEGSSYCVEEINLTNEVRPNCYTVGNASCSLGGNVAPPPVIPSTAISTTSNPTGSSTTEHGSLPTNNKPSGGDSLIRQQGGQPVKKMALLVAVPLILQLLFI
ncbi:hypothetical protein FBU30_009999 [Linnemannia zychae]|nr:hypothetical protein FBU30_009999 [Linnemannia zychae]